MTLIVAEVKEPNLNDNSKNDWDNFWKKLSEFIKYIPQEETDLHIRD